LKIRIADLIVETLVAAGINQAFSVTGGASMHLNDAAGAHPNLEVCYLHHEQACAMAAEGYARVLRRPALVITTAGPGALNTLNGVFGAYTDSMPMVVISGQARTNTLKRNYGLLHLRQLGDQEVEISSIVKEITKASFFFTAEINAQEIIEITLKAVRTAISGRPGPVWIEIPVDIQGTSVEVEDGLIASLVKREFYIEPTPDISMEKLSLLIQKLAESSRPALLIGTGVFLSGGAGSVISFAEKHDIPILTAWTHDQIDTSHRLFAGRPGTIGTRAGNLVLQNSDCIIVLGSRLNIRQISYNWEQFAPDAFICQVDIDENELQKPFPKISLGIHADVNQFMLLLEKTSTVTKFTKKYSNWLRWISQIKDRFGYNQENYKSVVGLHNSYRIIPEIFNALKPGSIVVCGDATACIVPFQTGQIRDGIRMFSNSGSASMGYDLPAAIGAAFAARERNIVCLAGDGSIMMNLQELQSIKSQSLNIKIFLLSNEGYLSIKQTQTNFFARQFGSSPDSGIEFPDFEKLASAFGIPSTTLPETHSAEYLENLVHEPGPKLIVVHLDPTQEFQPRIKSRILDGVIQTPSLDDMYPHLESGVLEQVRNSAKLIKD
jgi:acetolactate synthase-1/2/3 large subunit